MPVVEVYVFLDLRGTVTTKILVPPTPVTPWEDAIPSSMKRLATMAAPARTGMSALWVRASQGPCSFVMTVFLARWILVTMSRDALMRPTMTFVPLEAHAVWMSATSLKVANPSRSPIAAETI
jgi:hypothetical protein